MFVPFCFVGRKGRRRDMKFVELHSHSEYSQLRLIDSIIKIGDLVQAAFDKGLSGIAITDHEAVSGHIKALNKGKEIIEKNPDSDFKVILGNEIYLIDEIVKGKGKFYHFLLLAKNPKGHKQIRELSSRAWGRSFKEYKQERVPTLKKDIEEIVSIDRGNIIASTACLGSELAQLLLAYITEPTIENKKPIHEFITWCINCFGKEDFYIEIQASGTDEQKKYNEMAIKIAKAYGLKWIVTNDVHYLNKEDRPIHESYLKSREEEREIGEFYSYTYMKSVEDMREILDYLSEEDFNQAIENTMHIYDRIEVYSLSKDTVVPELKIESTNIRHIFKDWYDECPYLNNFAHSEYIQDRYFLQEVEKGFIEKNLPINKEYANRVDIEMQQLWEISDKLKQRLSAYYNLVQRCINIAWEDDKGNSIVGVARGSVTGFLTCYAMKITQIDPIVHNLPWWRHIHSSRPELPDCNFNVN